MRVIGVSPGRSDRLAIVSFPSCSHLRAEPSSGLWKRLVLGATLPNGPDDASELVSESDGGFVVSPSLLELEGPVRRRSG